jgi:hypothetical protein
MTRIGTQSIGGLTKAKKGNYDTLHLYALDHLSCPAMATQCERVFSAVRRTLISERNALRLKVLEACEYLRRWWRYGVMTRGSDRASYSPLELRSKPSLSLPYWVMPHLVEDDVELPIFYPPETVWTFPIRLFRYVR